MSAADVNTDDDFLEDAKEAHAAAVEAFADNYKDALDDVRFARLGEQWPEGIQKDRMQENRPCLTINRLPSFIRQVVNDARQNKPAITVHPVDSGADPETAEVFNGLIRHIEQSSDADVAYDTSLESAVTGGFGWFTINTRYATDDGFEQDLVIDQVANPFAITPDPSSTAADSSDWNVAFHADAMTKEAFEDRWDGADPVSFDSEKGVGKTPVKDGELVFTVAMWTREQSMREIMALSPMDSQAMLSASPDAAYQAMQLMGERMVVDVKVYEANKDLFDACGVKPLGQTRKVPSHKVMQRILSGADVLEKVNWAGKFIPIVPVYGEDLNIEGKRHLAGLVRPAKDPQRMFNYWRPLSLDTPLPTPTGWTTMGAVEIGEQLFDEAGQPCTVIGKSPVHINRDCFRVTFDDSTSIVADAEHPWPVEERGRRTADGWTWSRRLATTAELTPGRHFIDTPKPLDCADAELEAHPYALGMWLGDGSRHGGQITPGDEDVAEVVTNLEACGYRCGEPKKYGDRHATFTPYGLAPQLRAVGVLLNKHIPAKYLRASEPQRWALLRGLMDSDGSIGSHNKQCSFTTTTPALAAGFAELLRSLGIKAKSVVREGRSSKLVNGCDHLLEAHQFSFSAYADEPVFGLARKSAQLGDRPEHRRRTKRYAIRSVERVPSVPVQCVAIDAPSHLFLAGEGMVPTHNTLATELVALAPKTPFIGPVGAFVTDGPKWDTANTSTHAYIEYDGATPPQRQPFAGPPAGALQEALNASDDMKSIMGLHDASLGARSNETSGVAIMARQREGDVSSFHFIDNLSRSIRHAGRILIDLIPQVYSTPRMIRILGPEGDAKAVKIGPRDATSPGPVQGQVPGQAPSQPAPEGQETGQDEIKELEKVYDLTVGKYDLVVSAGPSFTTRREEAAQQMIELIRAYPAAAPLIGDLLAKNLDWPGADEIAERLHKLLPAQLQDDSPEGQAAKAQIMQMAQALGQARAEIQSLKTDQSLESRGLDIDAFEAETGRLKALAPKGVPTDPQMAAELAIRSMIQIMQSPDILEGMAQGADPQALAATLAQRMQPQQPGQTAPPQAA